MLGFCSKSITLSRNPDQGVYMKISYLLGGAILAAVIGDVVLLKHNRMDEEAWAAFRDTHHCSPLAHSDGSNRSGYLCDDGQVHYRWRQMR